MGTGIGMGPEALAEGAASASEIVEGLGARFGLHWVSHRIGSHALRFAEVRDADECVQSLYPGCVYAHGDAPVWMTSWPAAFGLAEFLVHEARPEGGRVLELGCGTAVAGVAAAAAGARVTATDHDPNALAFALHNARANGLAGLETRRLDWYAPDLPAGRFDRIIGSEITYHEKAFEPLAALIDQAVAPRGSVFLSDVFRKQTDVFLAACERRGWEVAQFERVVHLDQSSPRVRIARLRRRPSGEG